MGVIDLINSRNLVIWPGQMWPRPVWTLCLPWWKSRMAGYFILYPCKAWQVAGRRTSVSPGNYGGIPRGVQCMDEVHTNPFCGEVHITPILWNWDCFRIGVCGVTLKLWGAFQQPIRSWSNKYGIPRSSKFMENYCSLNHTFIVIRLHWSTPIYTVTYNFLKLADGIILILVIPHGHDRIPIAHFVLQTSFVAQRASKWFLSDDAYDYWCVFPL